MPSKMWAIGVTICLREKEVRLDRKGKRGEKIVAQSHVTCGMFVLDIQEILELDGGRSSVSGYGNTRCAKIRVPVSLKEG